MRTNETERLLLADMPALVEVVERGGFAAASRSLGVTPSVLSRQVSRLERTLAVRLLERDTRRLRPTDAGLAVLERCRAIRALAADAIGVAESHAMVPAGTIRLGAPRALGAVLLHPLLPEFLERWPGIDVRFRLSDRRLEPIADGLDLVVTLTDAPLEGLVVRRLGSVRLVLCASPRYLARAGVPSGPEDLAGHRCITLGDAPHERLWRFREPGGTGERVVRVSGRYSADHAGVRLDAARRGLGIAPLSDFVAREPLASAELVEVLAGHELLGPWRGDIVAQYPSARRQPPRLRALLDHLAARLGAADGAG